MIIVTCISSFLLRKFDTKWIYFMNFRLQILYLLLILSIGYGTSFATEISRMNSSCADVWSLVTLTSYTDCNCSSGAIALFVSWYSWYRLFLEIFVEILIKIRCISFLFTNIFQYWLILRWFHYPLSVSIRIITLFKKTILLDQRFLSQEVLILRDRISILIIVHNLFNNTRFPH